MADLNIMPWFTDAYLADTVHLKTIEHGAYDLLLLSMWRAGGSLPNDEALLQRITKCSASEWKRVWPIVSKFFAVEGERLTQKRLASEFSRAEEKVRQNRQNASKGGKAKSLNNKERPVANASHSLEVRQSETRAESCPTVNRKPLTEESISAVPMARAAKPSEEFEKFWASYPKRDGANPKHPAEKAFLAAVKSGTAPADIVGAADRYRSQMRTKGQEGTPYVQQAVNWLKQRRWQDYREDGVAADLEAEFTRIGRMLQTHRDRGGSWPFPSEPRHTLNQDLVQRWLSENPLPERANSHETDILQGSPH